MAGLNRNYTARNDSYQNIQYLTKDVTFADNGTQITMGKIPAGSLIVKPISGVQINEAFNAGTNNYIQIGIDSNDDLYGTNLAGGTVTFVPLDEAVAFKVLVDTIITIKVDLSGTAATTGKATGLIAFVPPN